MIDGIEGVSVAHRWHPIASAGLYVPQGRGRFPSMMIMLAVPARLAHVGRIAVMTPPDGDGVINPATLYVAQTLGIDEIYKIGGAQAMAVMAFGTESIAPVDKIFGPGSIYVSIARYLLRDVVDCGMPAGASEAMIIADEQADARTTALDLLIEAEHGRDSRSFLVTPSRALGSEVARIAEAELVNIPEPRRGYIRAVLSDYGGVLICKDIDEAVAIAQRAAPEHLKIDTRNSQQIARAIGAAGEILLGQESAFSIANYLTGANSILPTNRGARSWSAISVSDFCIRRAEITITPAGFKGLAPHAIALAKYEGFHAHAHALAQRHRKSQSHSGDNSQQQRQSSGKNSLQSDDKNQRPPTDDERA